MRQFLVQRWFLLTLVAVLAVAIGFAPGLEPVSKLKGLRDCIVACVLFLMALPLERAMWRSIRRPLPPLLAVAVNLGLLPLIAWPLASLLNHDLGAGLLVAAVTPCTLASASVWTRRAGGNDAVSILVTILTNSTCFVVMPLWLYVLTGAEIEASPELSLANMASKLAVLVVLPMTIAQLLRLYAPLGVWATRQKSLTGVLAQCGILTMVFLGAIGTGMKLRDVSDKAFSSLDLILMLVAVCVVHLLALWLGVVLAKGLRVSREDQIAIAFAGSQKTLMVGLLVSISMQVSILPMVTYHVSQLFLDTLVADYYRRQTGVGA